jgi:hypothetical protein
MISAPIRRWVAWTCYVTVVLAVAAACRSRTPSVAQARETVSRTEFTERIENFFEHEPLIPGKPSAFLIHLTDLADGAPVEKADVTLTLRSEGGDGTETKAKVGRVTGIYVAEVSAPAPGTYSIEFRVKNAALDERMVLTDSNAGEQR